MAIKTTRYEAKYDTLGIWKYPGNTTGKLVLEYIIKQYLSLASLSLLELLLNYNKKFYLEAKRTARLSTSPLLAI